MKETVLDDMYLVPLVRIDEYQEVIQRLLSTSIDTVIGARLTDFPIRFGNKVLFDDPNPDEKDLVQLLLLMSIKETESTFDKLLDSYRVTSVAVPVIRCYGNEDRLANYLTFYKSLDVEYKVIEGDGSIGEVVISDGENIDIIQSRFYSDLRSVRHVFLHRDEYASSSVKKMVRDSREQAIKSYLTRNRSMIDYLRRKYAG